MYQKTFCFITLSIFLSHIQSTSASECISDGYYNCDQNRCPCPLDPAYNVEIQILSVVSIFFALILVFGYLLSKQLREQPGDFFFGFALGEVALAITSLVEVIHDSKNTRGLHVSEEFCKAISVSRVLFRQTIRSYQVSYIIFYLASLRHSLKSSRIPKFFYHFIPWLVGIISTVASHFDGSLGKSLQGTCDYKSSGKKSIYIVELILCILGVLSVPFLIRRLYSRSSKLGPSTKRHLRYYLIYFIFAIILLSLTFLTKIIGANAMLVFEENADYTSLAGVFYSEKVIIYIDTVSPIFLTIIRLSDPFMRQHWGKLFLRLFCCCCLKKPKADTESPIIYMDGDDLTTRLRNTSLNAGELEASLQKKPFLYQVLQNYKIQVVYTLLAAIHYHWKIDKEKFYSIQNHRGDDEYYNKKAKVLFRHQISNAIIGGVVPEVLKEVHSKNHDILPGRLTVHAPDLFQELTDLDGIGQSLIYSLDLARNYSRILKSGNMQQGGRGGEFFFFSDDNKLIIKTVNKKELDVLLGILPRYVQHFERNPKSLIAKIYAVFTFEVENPYEEFHLILMKNINGYPSSCIARKYDLKGSTVDREVLTHQQVDTASLKMYGTLKDKDFDKYEGKFNIQEDIQYQLLDTLVRDVAFFRMENLIDYSLAVYLIDKTQIVQKEDRSQSLPNKSLINVDHDNETISRSGSVVESSFTFLDGRTQTETSIAIAHPLISVPSTTENLDYHLGIIDYLTKYDWKKRGEKFYKQLKAFNFGLDTSCQDPHTYNRRFLGYMEKIIVESHCNNDEPTQL